MRNPMNIIKNDEIDLIALFRLLWKNVLAIALVGILVGVAAFAVTVMFITPTYEATTSLYINSSAFSLSSASLSISTGELNTSNALVPSYIYILNSRTTMEDVIAEADLSYSADELKKMVEAEGVDDTSAFEVTVTSTSPSEAELIANTIAKVLPDRFAEVVDGSAVRIVDYAIIPAHRASPSILKNTVIGILIGGFLSAAWVVVRALMDEHSRVVITSVDDLRELFPGSRVLGVIPDMRVAGTKYGYYDSYYGAADAKKKGGR